MVTGYTHVNNIKQVPQAMLGIIEQSHISKTQVMILSGAPVSWQAMERIKLAARAQIDASEQLNAGLFIINYIRNRLRIACGASEGVRYLRPRELVVKVKCQSALDNQC